MLLVATHIVEPMPARPTTPPEIAATMAGQLTPLVTTCTTGVVMAGHPARDGQPSSPGAGSADWAESACWATGPSGRPRSARMADSRAIWVLMTSPEFAPGSKSSRLMPASLIRLARLRGAIRLTSQEAADAANWALTNSPSASIGGSSLDHSCGLLGSAEVSQHPRLAGLV